VARLALAPTCYDSGSIDAAVMKLKHDLAGRLVCQKCKSVGKRPAATLLQLAPRQRYTPAKE
jgi:hypothetical protein